MFVRYIKQCCSDCKSVLDEPALCLLCGRLCSPSWKPCCRYAVHPSSLGFIKIMWLQHTQPDLFNINFFFDSIMFKVNNYIPILKFLNCLFLPWRESSCQSHAMACGAGTGVFLLIRVCSAPSFNRKLNIIVLCVYCCACWLLA